MFWLRMRPASPWSFAPQLLRPPPSRLTPSSLKSFRLKNTCTGIRRGGQTPAAAKRHYAGHPRRPIRPGDRVGYAPRPSATAIRSIRCRKIMPMISPMTCRWPSCLPWTQMPMGRMHFIRKALSGWEKSIISVTSSSSS